MSRVLIHKQVHGYKQGHQLLASSVVLGDRDQDAVDRLSDLAGPLRPGESFDPYLTAYPLPSGAYFVMARTFQDLGAARSGCVRTLSVLIPMGSWDGVESVEGVLAELLCSGTDVVASEVEVSTERSQAPEKVADRRMVGLVDALFSDRRPVVFFDCAESEAIAVRLMLALWPAARRCFSVCTFALGPRSVENRHFDLVFAPTSARSRFVGMGYRRMGAEPGRNDAEAGWAKTAAWWIFHSEDPSLSRLDSLGLLRAEEEDDRASLRVVLLWNDLASRADDNPTAALGMLDIVRSRKARRQDAWWRDLEVTIVRAIGAAADRMPVEKAWEFLFAMEAKVGGWASPIVEEHIELGARRLAGRDTRVAFAALLVNPSRRFESRRTLKGLADGAAESGGLKELFGEVQRLPPSAVVHLMASSSRLIRGVVEVMNVERGDWVDVFLGAFEAADEKTKRDIRRETLVVAEGMVVERVVPSLLRDVTCPDVAALAVEMVETRGTASWVLNGLLWAVAREVGGGEAVRDAVMGSSNTAQADSFVLQSLALNRPDIDWLARRKGEEQRTSGLLRALLGAAEDEEISRLPQSSARNAVALLATNLKAGRHEVARVLALDVVRDEEMVEIGFQTLAALDTETAQSEFGRWVLRASLSDAVPGDGRVGTVLRECGPGLAGLDLVEAVVSSRASAGRVSANLVALDTCEANVRDRAVTEVEALSERLVARAREDLGAVGYSAWASMIRDWKRRSSGEEQVRVANSVFRFALQLLKIPVSALVVETFPITYGSLPKAKRRRRRDGFTSLFSPYYALWLGLGEWEDGRERAINELVRAFMDSKWLPADLMIAALEAGVEKKVIKQLRERSRGRHYMDEIRQDADRLRKGERTRVLKCITRDR